MNIKFSKVVRMEFIILILMIISFCVFFITKFLSFLGILKFSNTLNNIEFFSFFMMVTTLVIFLKFLFKKRNLKELDIREKKEQLELRLSAIDSTNAIIEFKPNGDIISINKTFSNIFGYGNEIIGRHHSMLVPKKISKSKEYIKFWKDLSEGIHKFDEFERINKYGDVVWIARYLCTNKK